MLHCRPIIDDSSRDQKSAPTRRGFTLVEVMLAVVVLAGALTVMVGDFLTSQQGREVARQQVLAQEIGRSLLMRLQGAPVARLGVATDPWGLARHEGGGTPAPLVDDGSLGANDLVTLGIRSTTGNLPGLRIFVEYYRGIATPDPSSGNPALLPGVMDALPVGADPTQSYSQLRTGAWLPRRLSAALPPAAQVPANSPVLIRIIVVWDDIKRIELHGGRLF